MKYYFSYLFLFLINTAFCQIAINEISQGSNNGEYIELVVVGPNDGCSVDCVDLRGWILDDNNGWHSTPPQSGNGIADGHIRFRNIALWSCVRVGSIIVIYNDTDVNPKVPAADETDANSDCVYILPYNSNNFEHTTALPTLTNTSYTPATYTTGGNWVTCIMKNADDTYQIINPANLTTYHHAVSWGSNNFLPPPYTQPKVYFTGSASGNVMYMANQFATDPDNPYRTPNWVNTNITTSNETPGLGNTPANIAWIDTLRNGCMPFNPSSSPLNDEICVGQSSNLSAVGGGTYIWSTNETTPNISVSPTTTSSYTVTISSDYGCTAEEVIPITVNPSPMPEILGDSILCDANNLTLDAGAGFANYSWDPNSEMSQTIMVNSIGTYTVTVTDSNTCTGTDDINIIPVDLNFIRD